MTSAELKVFAPLATPLPPPKDGQVLTDSQWTTLMAIADTVIPSVQVSTEQSPTQFVIQASDYTTSTEIIKKAVPTKDSAEKARQYLNERPSSIPDFREAISRLLSDHLRDDAQKGIRVILSALESVSHNQTMFDFILQRAVHEQDAS